MERYETKEWKELEKIQNANDHVDILTITGFMNHEQFLKHVRDCKKRFEK